MCEGCVTLIADSRCPNLVTPAPVFHAMTRSNAQISMVGMTTLLLALCIGAVNAFYVPPAGLTGFGHGVGSVGLRPQHRTLLQARPKPVDLSKPNPYVVLGVDPKTASAQDIKKAYRSKAAMYHPDVNQQEGAQEQFLIVQEAFQRIGDENMRRRYDMAGNVALPDDFAERIEFMNEKGGTGYVRFVKNVDNLMNNDKLVVTLNIIPMVMLLLVMSFFPDFLHDLVLGKRPSV